MADNLSTFLFVQLPTEVDCQEKFHTDMQNVMYSGGLYLKGKSMCAQR